jgi:hypothetical protein
MGTKSVSLILTGNLISYTQNLSKSINFMRHAKIEPGEQYHVHKLRCECIDYQRNNQQKQWITGRLDELTNVHVRKDDEKAALPAELHYLYQKIASVFDKCTDTMMTTKIVNFLQLDDMH